MIQRTFYSSGQFHKVPLTPLMREDLGCGHLYQRAKVMLACQQHCPMPKRLGWRQLDATSTFTDVFEQLKLGMRDSGKDLLEYEDSMLKKCGPQGGCIPGTSIIRCYEEQYKLASLNPTCVGLEDGLDYLLSSIIDLINRVGYPQEIHNASPGKQFSGFPCVTSKNSIWAQGESDWMRYTRPYFQPYPNAFGTRYQRLKDRTINMDSNLNVDYIQPLLSKIRYWLRAYLPHWFGSWCNPSLYDAPAISAAMRKRYKWFEGDYTKIDEHFSRNCYDKWVAPIYKLLLSAEEFSAFDTFVRQLFEQPLFMGDYMWTGLHNLFSGQAITNDFETIFTVVLLLQMALMNGSDPSLCVIKALGDDSLLGVKRWTIDPIEVAIQLATSNGHEFTKEKQRLSDNPRYLRRTYDLSFPKYPGSDVIIGAYPAVLTVNSLLNPEFPLESIEENFVASIQICDNLYGHPQYANIVSKLWTHWRGNVSQTVRDVEVTDWWSKLYGTTWAPQSSPTVRLLQRNNQVKQPISILLGN